jgi:hypothetical protein
MICFSAFQSHILSRCASLLCLSILAGISYFYWEQLQQNRLQGFEAELEVPLTARSDIMQLYAQSPFEKTVIKFPAADISTRYVLRLWVDREQDATKVRNSLKHYLDTYYVSSDKSRRIMLSAEGFAIANLNAEVTAKRFELNYLQNNYPKFRQNRITNLKEDIAVLDNIIDVKYHTSLSATSHDKVIIHEFEPISNSNLARASLVRSLLVAIAIALMQLIWLQQSAGKHVDN